MGNICSQIRGHTAPGCIAVSLIKGVHFDESGDDSIPEYAHMNATDVCVCVREREREREK
jgi:hypothetical protein